MRRVAILSGFHESGHQVMVETLIASRPTDVEITTTGPILRDESVSLRYLGEIFRECSRSSLPVPEALSSKTMLNAISDLMENRLREVLEDSDDVVCTHPYTAYAVAEAARRASWNGRIVEIHTNFTSYPVFYHSRVDAVCGARLARVDLKVKNTFFTGIPVRSQFLGRESVRTDELLLVGGADGFAPLRELRDRLRAVGRPIVIATGRNTDLASELAVDATPGERIVCGEDDLSVLMKTCRAVVTKASGVTVAEALAAHAPLVFPPSIIPWEREAEGRLLTAGVGIAIPDWSSSAISSVALALNDDQRMHQLSHSGDYLVGTGVADLWCVALGRSSRAALAQGPSSEDLDGIARFIGDALPSGEAFSRVVASAIEGWRERWQ